MFSRTPPSREGFAPLQAGAPPGAGMPAATEPTPVVERAVVDRRPVVERRLSLSRGPAWLMGIVLLAAGLYFLYRQHRFPPLGNFPNGRAPVNGDVFFGVFGANGWTGMGTAIAGGLLLVGAAEHLLAKTLSLAIGLVLAVAAIVAAISGDVFGLAAANRWTEVGWGAGALILLLNTAVPPRRRTLLAPGVSAPSAAGTAVPTVSTQPTASGEPWVDGEHVVGGDSQGERAAGRAAEPAEVR